MGSSDFLYQYVFIEDTGNGEDSLGFYFSKAVPPPIGTTIDLGEFFRSSNPENVLMIYRIKTIQFVPVRGGSDPSDEATEMQVKITVVRLP